MEETHSFSNFAQLTYYVIVQMLQIYEKGFTSHEKRTIIQLPQGQKPKRHGITVYILEKR